MEGEGISTLVHPDDPDLQESLFRRLGELRHSIFANHLKSLSPDEQASLRSGTHVSQSHKNHEAAQPFVEMFTREFGNHRFIESIKLGFYHGDRLVISVSFGPGTARAEIAGLFPAYYRGFEVKLGAIRLPGTAHD